MDPGTDEMQEISRHVGEGAQTYLWREYRNVFMVLFVVFVILLVMSLFGYQSSMLAAISFLTGGVLSALAGYVGMNVATRANCRTANGAREGFGKGFSVAFSSGSTMGLTVVGLGLLLITVWFTILRAYYGASVEASRTVSGVLLAGSMGASFVALFARVGGGIFTKAADMGADLVGKVEAGIPEDDPRNAGVIADNVGDNVGDVAGMGADLYESYLGAVVSAMALGVAAYDASFEALILPLMIAAIGIISSILGMLFVRVKDEKADASVLLRAMRRGNYATSIFVALFSFFVIMFITNNPGLYVAIIAGLLAGILVGRISEQYTSEAYTPTRNVAENARTGAATVIIAGMANGMVSAVFPVILVAVAMLASFYFSGSWTGSSFDFSSVSASRGLYGIALSAVGMLSTLGFTLSTDAYGPVADNAGGITQMCGLGEEVRERTDAFDSIGNTTAATGKGFAVGSAALTAAALIATYKDTIDAAAGVSFVFDLMDPNVLVSVFIGAMLPFFFSSLILNAVGRAAFKMVEEIRVQFHREGVMEGKVKPDYSRCVDISTRSAIREMMAPALIAILSPILVGVLLGPEAVGGLLIGALASGFVLAVYMANAGGSWDNAKKFIEGGNLGGKGSDAHKAAVVGDTVGDPLKDAAGPSLNILIKLMSIVSVVFAALFFVL